MKPLNIALLLTVALSLAACGGGGTPAPTPDTTPPSTVSITPASGATGVAKDANIVVTFSEKMNQAATQAAYQSTDLPAASVTFSWNADGTALTINPNADLAYTALGKTYSFSLSTTATDLAGNALPATNSSFKTFKQLITTLSSTPALDGYLRSEGLVNTTNTVLLIGDSADVGNATYRSFLSFDLSGLPAGRIVEAAKLNIYQEAVFGSPYTDLKLGSDYLVLDHMNYGSSLTFPDYNAAALSSLGNFISSTTLGNHFKSTLSAVQADLAAGRSRSQYRLSFAKPTDGDGIGDYVQLYSGDNATNKPTLEITYLIP